MLRLKQRLIALMEHHVLTGALGTCMDCTCRLHIANAIVTDSAWLSKETRVFNKVNTDCGSLPRATNTVKNPGTTAIARSS